MSNRKALVNLALYGYGVVRNIKGVAVTVPTDAGTVVLSNQAFSRFLEIENGNDRLYMYEQMAQDQQDRMMGV